MLEGIDMRGMVVGLLALTALSGCATTNSAAPNLIQGHYYVAGDSGCVRYGMSKDGSTVIACLNEKGEVTGYRRPMTPDEMQMYQMVQAQQQAADQQFYDRLAENNQSIANYKYPQMAPPHITPLGRDPQTRCISTGFYTSCQ
jgi:hypothetical protein